MLPTKTPKFQDYIAPAMATNQIWRLVVGIVVLAVFYFVFVFALFGLISYLDGSFNAMGLDMNDPKSIVVLLLSFFGMFFGVLLAVRLLHKRGLKSLLGQNIRSVTRNAIYGFAVICILAGMGMFVFSFIDPPTRQMEVSVWLSWMVLAIPLLFVQILSEELIFRGYFQQQLAARFDSRWVWYVLPSVAFGALHYDAETMGSNAWLVVAHTTLFGLIAADLTARTGNLGAAIGMHFANNLFALTIVTLDGSLSGLGLYLTSMHVSDVEQIRNILTFDLCLMIALYGSFLYWARNKAEL